MDGRRPRRAPRRSGDHWARTIVETGRPNARRLGRPDDAPTGAALVPYFRDGARELLDTLAAADPAASVWTFRPDRTAAFWYRRPAHETAVHRVDAQSAAGTPSPIDAELAVRRHRRVPHRVRARAWPDGLADLGGGTIHFHCTDVEGEWLIAPTGDDVVVTAEHAKGDVAARGTASDLLLFLWGRVPANRLEVFGDAALLDRFATGSGRQGVTGASARMVVRGSSPPAPGSRGPVVVTPFSA